MRELKDIDEIFIIKEKGILKNNAEEET